MEDRTYEQQTAPAPKIEIVTPIERRRRWRAVKKEERAALKERLRYAPVLLRWWILYLWKPALVIVAAAILAVILYQPAMSLISDIVRDQFYEVKDRPLSEEDMPKLYELSPLDEEGAEKIDAYPAVRGDETWTICVYMVASDLEDMGENDLSYVTRAMTQQIAAENYTQGKEKQLEHLMRFDSELKENGLELPSFFYYPEKPTASSTVVTENVRPEALPAGAIRWSTRTAHSGSSIGTECSARRQTCLLRRPQSRTRWRTFCVSVKMNIRLITRCWFSGITAAVPSVTEWIRSVAAC